MPVTMPGWQLHEQLKGDTHYLGAMAASHLLLHRDAGLHWFILVPETGALDLMDLAFVQRNGLMGDADRVSRYLKEVLGYPRVNIGALGLVVPQLHLHVVGRRPDDPCWPAPVWGKLQTGERYTEEAVKQFREALCPS